MTAQIGWGLNVRAFLQQMVPHLERQPRPFAAWMITLSLHHPFESFPDAHKELKLGALEGTSFGNYLHTMRFFDNALETFKASLARDGLLDDSLVVVFGDHARGGGGRLSCCGRGGPARAGDLAARRGRRSAAASATRVTCPAEYNVLHRMRPRVMFFFALLLLTSRAVHAQDPPPKIGPF